MAILEGYKVNLETILRAGENGDLCIMEYTERETGETAFLLCAAGWDGEGYEITPLARMIDGNPFELFTPPA